MKVITTTNARKHIKHLLDQVRINGEVFALGRRESIDALLIPFPSYYNKDLNEITNINTLSHSFDFLADEPDLYSPHDLKKKYA